MTLSSSGHAASLQPPPWVSSLPVEDRGFRVPAETPWYNGKPVLSQVGTAWKLALGYVRACAVCGYRLMQDQPVYRAFSSADAASIRTDERDAAQDLSGPGHLSCMLYSAQVCPYLRVPTARLGRNNGVAPGARRGQKASILGFKDYMIAMPQQGNPYGEEESEQAYFVYFELVQDFPYRRGEDLKTLYELSIANDSCYVDIDTGQQFYWRSETDMVSLLRKAQRLLGKRRNFEGYASILGEPYNVHRVPLLNWQ